MAPTLFWGLIALLVALAVAIAIWAYQTANRLNRLHVRYDMSWQALDAALGRRSVVARAIAAEIDDTRLAGLAVAAEQASRPDREACENALSGALSQVDPDTVRPALAAELAEAESRVLLARRFHNDAVRDTLALRDQRPVRLLRLGGHAALPTYFEIAEPAQR